MISFRNPKRETVWQASYRLAKKYVTDDEEARLLATDTLYFVIEELERK
jgi:hypothetical protein